MSLFGGSDNLSLGESGGKTWQLQRISDARSRIPVFFFFFLVESVTNKVALKTLEYSLIMNNMSLLNFDSLSCWVVIVLPSLEYDYIRPLILTGLHSLFRHTAREEEMKWENVKPQEKTTLEDQFLTIALKTVKAWDQNKSVHNNILQPSLGQNLLSERAFWH